jgi:glucosylceramidase
MITTAFKNPDGSLVVVVMNPSDETFTYNLWVEGNGAETTSAPHSISTLVIR